MDTVLSIESRLKSATKAELSRICGHLGIKKDSSIDAIQTAYTNAADNSIFQTIRGIIPSDSPTYSKVLRLIYQEMRPFSESLKDNLERVKSVKFWKYNSRISSMGDQELESHILEIFIRKHRKAYSKITTSPKQWMKILPTVGGAAGSATVAVTAQTAFRLPFAAATPGVVAGPVGLGLSIMLLGTQLAGPSFRKIIPATIELILIGKRIECMPEE